MKQTGSQSISYFKFNNTFQANNTDSKHAQIGKTRKKVKDLKNLVRLILLLLPGDYGPSPPCAGLTSAGAWLGWNRVGRDLFAG
jgi:hypothetical protein